MNIKKVMICGGTHGNELSGVYAVKHWMEHPDKLKGHITSAKLDFLLVNQASIDARVRYLDEDLNRQFDLQKLVKNAASNELNKEQALAQTLNTRFGPKTSPQLDFIIDIHNTTSAMGPTLIVLDNDDFTRNLARFVKQAMPEANILVEDHIAYREHPYFCTLAKRSVMVEVGPQAQGALRAKAYQQTLALTEHILRYIELVNCNDPPTLSEVEAFRLTNEVAYPVTESGERAAMIHPSLDGQDFKLLEKGMPCFIDFQGNDILWQDERCYPHFIGEAAYDGLGLAFASANLCKF